MSGFFASVAAINFLFVIAVVIQPASGVDPKWYYSDAKSIELIKAVDKEDLEAIDRLISDGGVKPDTMGHHEELGQMTPLLWAFCKGRKRAFERLLIKGADPNLAMQGPLIGGSVLNYAARDDDSDWLKFVLKHRGNPNLADDFWHKTPLVHAVDCRDTTNVKLLVAAGADINHRDSNGATPLISVPGDNYEMAYCLLELGADYKLKTTAAIKEDFAWRLWNMPPEGSVERKWYNKIVDFLEKRKFDFGAELKRAETEHPEVAAEWKMFMDARAAKKAGK
jgi:hypothetical protein